MKPRATASACSSPSAAMLAAAVKSAMSISALRPPNTTKTTSPSIGTTIFSSASRIEFASAKPVKIFVMGKNEWRNEDAWPLERAKMTSYLLHSAGKANSASGDGALSTAACAIRVPRHLRLRSRQSCSHRGRPALLRQRASRSRPARPEGRRSPRRRPRLLHSAARSRPEVTGPVTLELYATSSAVDTDFTAKLVDVGPTDSPAT